MRIDNRGRSDLDHQCPIHVIRLVDKSQRSEAVPKDVIALGVIGI